MDIIINALHSVAKILPKVKPPTTQPSSKDRLMWTGAALVLFFMMYHVSLLGINASIYENLDFLQTITASSIGSLLTAGIGPIVLSSIFLQLFVGAGLIKLNLKVKEEREKFHEVQKILAILLAIVEAIIYTMFTLQGALVPLFPNDGFICELQSPNVGANGIVDAAMPFIKTHITVPTLQACTTALLQTSTVAGVVGFSGITIFLVILQIALGSVILLYLDEVISKYGLGSGISLFIAGGVALAIVGGTFGLIGGANGVIPTLVPSDGSTPGADAIPTALLILLPLLFTALVFLVSVFAEGIKVEIPIAYEQVRGIGNKLPLKFFYVSNIPVIFASALLLNMQLFGAGILPKHLVEGSSVVDTVAAQGDLISKYIGFVIPSSQPGQFMLADGLLYFLTPPRFGGANFMQHMTSLATTTTPLNGIPEWVHALTYILFLSLVSVLFGLFWVETSNMDAKSVAGQLSDSGIQIPGFRRDPRLLEKRLNEYIFPLTVLGSFSVGLLAGVADLTGALGTGTGILLTVGILYRMYEQMEQLNMFELYPALKSIVGE